MALSRGQLTRQKMINLMYLVFIAMLALNVPTEVLDGFDLVNENLQESIKVADERNKQIYTDISASYESNPEKTQDSYNRALNVKGKTDSLFNYIEYLKLEIAKKSDGKDADLGAISHLDIKNQSMDEITMIFDGGTGSQPQAGNYIPPHLTMKKGTNEVKVVIPNNLSGNYILTLPQESGTLLTAGNLTIDNLNSTLTDKALSANQGRILKNSVDNINTLLTSNDTTLDTLQEIVNFIKINKNTLSALTIDSIAGLNNALNSKQNLLVSGNNIKTINNVSLLESGNIDLTIDSIAGLETALTNKLDKNQNAVSASKLATTRTIGGVSFDGTSNINLPGVNTAGNQNTTGNSATASKLATPVKINNKLFDGSTNINLEEDAMVVKEKVVNLTGDIIQTSLGSVFIKTITKNTTLSLTTNYNIGETNSFILELTNGGNYTINLWDNIKWNGGVAPELTNNGKDILGFYSYGSPRVTIGAVISKDAK